MTDVVGIAGDRIRSFVERIEQLDTELQELNEQKKEVLAEAKGEGFDVKVLKEISGFANRTRTNGTSTTRCSTSTCGPWTQPNPLRSPKLRRPSALVDGIWLFGSSHSTGTVGSMIGSALVRSAGPDAACQSA